MRVFMTGAAGFIGEATVRDLLKHGHTVLALVRKPEQADHLRNLGAEPHMGSLEDTASLRSGAEASDGVIHLAFHIDVPNFMQAFVKGCALDRAAITALAEGLSPGQPLVLASGTMLCVKGATATEETGWERNFPPFSERALSADLLQTVSQERGIRGSTVRLSPTVHGAGDHGFMAEIAGSCKKAGVAVYPDDGTARWNAIHRDDAASVFRLALEKGRAGGIYHACAEEGVAMKDIAGVFGKRLGIEVKGLPVQEAVGVIGMFASFMAVDGPASSVATQRELGWSPKQVGLLEDLEKNYEF